MKSIKFLLLSAFLVFFAGSAYALPSTSFFKTDGSVNNVQDDSVEWLLNRVIDQQGEVTWTDSSSGDSILGQDDRIRGVLSFNNINGTPVGAGSANADLSGIFDITVLSVEAYQAGPATRYYYTFGPTASIYSGFSGDNIAIEMYDDPAQDFTLYPFTGVSRADLEDLASNAGGPVMEVGFALDSFWFADSATNDVLTLFAGPSGAAGYGQFGLSLISNTLGLVALDTLGADGNMHDIVGNTFLLDPLDSSGDLINDTDIFFRATAIPEPATLALFGLGLLGLSGLTRRKS